MNAIGLDYGDKTIGVAVSDPLGITAQGVTTLYHEGKKTLARSIGEINRIIKERGITAVVLGFPKNMDGTQGERCQKTLDFKRKLENVLNGVPVYLVDERLTTVSATRILNEGGASREEWNRNVDKVAAALILQSFLDSKKFLLKDRGD